MELESATDYDLCASYCDVCDWLRSPLTGFVSPETREKYEGYMRDILLEISRRYSGTEEEK